MTGRVMGRAAATLAVMMWIAGSGATAVHAEDLPWGKTAVEPRVITPSTTYDPDDLEPYDDYDTTTGQAPDDDAWDDGSYRDTSRRRTRQPDRYQEDPDYSTYSPAVPEQEWSDEDDGLIDSRPTRRTVHRRRIPAEEPRSTYHDPNPSRFGGTFTADEIIRAGHTAFGQVAKGFASVVEYAFQRQGRPNGYIIGQEAGGAIVAGLRYGEGVLYTKHSGTHTVYWQGPSVGYDFGAEGSKTMILVYDMRTPSDIYGRFGGVDGSAYLVGGVGITFQQNGHVKMAPIRSGVGVRLGANVGYLKYSRVPTWNPF